MATFKPNPNLINSRLAEAAHAGTSWSPEQRAKQEIAEFVEDIETVYNDLMQYANNEAEMDVIDVEMITFQERYAQKYNDKLSAHSQCISSMIAGPSGFPSRRAERANSSYEKRFDEMMQFKKRAIDAIKKKIKAHRIDEAGGEIEILKAKIASAEKMHGIMKAGNKIIRSKKLSDDEKIFQMVEIGISESNARAVLRPDYMGTIGFKGWELSNNNANIKRMKARLVEMQTREATPTSEISFDGGIIIDNAEIDRVQIVYDEKPTDEVIGKLKGAGWHWSPRNSAWQRKRTANAMQSAKQITEG